MSSSEVDLGTAAAPGQYKGTVTGLQGGAISANVNGPRGPIELQINVSIDRTSNQVSGSVNARPMSTP